MPLVDTPHPELGTAPRPAPRTASRETTEATEAATAPEPPPSMIGRMTLIIDAFESRTSRLTLEEVACRTRLPRSTAHRILDQLVGCLWLEHTPYGYRLGQRALGLGGQDGSRGEIREAAAPLLHELHLRTGAVVHLAVLDGKEVVYLDKVGGRFASGLPSRVGGRAPAHATGVGKAMLAWVEPEQVDALLPYRLPCYTSRTISSLPTLRQELDRVRRRRGLAFDHGEALTGVACVAASLRGPEGPVAAISLSGEEGSARLEQAAPLVVGAAREASRSLFPELDSGRRARQRPRAAEAPRPTWSPEVLDRLIADGREGEWL